MSPARPLGARTVAALACMLFATSAAAQPSRHHRSRDRHAREGHPPPSGDAAAQALFQAGVAFTDQRRWAEALDAFERSLALTPRASTRFNIATTLLQLGRYRGAVAAFEAHQNATERDTDPARVAQSPVLLARARSGLVALALSGVPSGAEVLVDGAAEAGDGAARELRLDPGVHHLEVRTRDGRAERFDVTLTSGAPASHVVDAALSAAPGPPTTVAAPTLNTLEAQAAFAQGREALAARRYDRASAAFHEAARIEATPGTWRWLGVTLRSVGRYTESIAALERYLAAPEPGVAPAQLEEVGRAVGEMRRSLAQLTVTVLPTSAVLQVDGRTRAVLPDAMTLDPGAHAVELRADGYEPMHQEVELAAAGQMVLNLRLVPLAGRLVVEPSVTGALVVIDGREAGRGRVERAATPGEHVVEIRAEGYEPMRRVVRVTSAGVMRLDATLVRRGTPGWVVPVAIAGGVLVAAGVATAVVVATQPEEVVVDANWGSIR